MSNLNDFINVGANTGNFQGNVNAATLSGNGLQITGNAVLAGNSFAGNIPTGSYSIAPLNITNNGTAGQTKTQLNLINETGGAGTGSAIDFYTYPTSNIPSTRLSVTDNNFSGQWNFFTKAPGAANNALVNRLSITNAGNIEASGNVSAVGNISASYFLGNGSQLTGIDATSIQNGNSNVRVLANSNVTVGISGTSNVVVISTQGITTSNVYTNGINSSNANSSINFWIGDTDVGTISNVSVAIGANAGVNAQSVGAIAIGFSAGSNTQGNNSVAMGPNAGRVTQSALAVAIGSQSGQTNQGISAVAIGQTAGSNTQGISAVAVGDSAGVTNQGTQGVAVGLSAGQTNQGQAAVAIGASAGSGSQGIAAVAIGPSAAVSSQSASAVAIGDGAGRNIQGGRGIAIGTDAANLNQGNSSVAIGAFAGQTNQGQSGVAVGTSAGSNTQGINAVAIGTNSGINNQAASSVAIGDTAGANTQGGSSIAIGRSAGNNAQGTNSIALGTNAGLSSQGNSAISIGISAGRTSQGTQSIAIGDTAGQANQRTGAIAIGIQAGSNAQGTYSTAIGVLAGDDRQGSFGIGIGFWAGKVTQGSYAIALGELSGSNAQGNGAVAIGRSSGNILQGTSAVAIGSESGTSNQGEAAVAVGEQSGRNTQAARAVAVGAYSGRQTQGENSIAVGYFSGFTAQGNNSIGIGSQSAQQNQGANSVAIGIISGQIQQGTSAVAIGYNAGGLNQGTNSIAIGTSSGANNQGNNSIAIGALAGNVSQVANSIVISAGNVEINPTNEGFYVNPIRQDANFTGNLVYYNPATDELTYNNVYIAENGSISIPQQTTPALSNNFIDVTGGIFTIPSAGTWEISYSLMVTSSTGNWVTVAVTDMSANLISPSYMTTGISSPNVPFVIAKTFVITTTGPRQLKLRTQSYNNTTVTIYQGTSAATGQSILNWQKIGGFAPATGSTTSYITAGRLTNQLSVGFNTDIIWNSQLTQGGNLSLNTTTGVFTLQAGVTYSLYAALSTDSYTDTTSGFLAWQWVDATTNSPITATNQAIGIPMNRNTNEYTPMITSGIYTPSTNQTVKVRVTGSNGTASIRANQSIAQIVQIGTTDTSGFTGVMSNIWNINNTYPSGTIVLYTDNNLYQSNSLVPSGTAFIIGTTGATWKRINSLSSTNVSSQITITGSTSNPTKGTRSVDNITLVDDGSGWCTVNFQYVQTNNSAVGSGIYLFALPGGYQFDTTVHPLDSNASSSLNYTQIAQVLPGGSGFISWNGAAGTMAISPFSATTFKISTPGNVGLAGSSGWTVWSTVGSSYFNLSGPTPIAYSGQFRFKKA